MFTRILGALLVVSAAVRADDIISQVSQVEELAEETSAEVKGGCKQFSNLTVCNLLKAGSLQVVNNATIGGNLSVVGSVTAASFNTPFGPFISGLRNYAVLSNQSTVATGTVVPWSAGAFGSSGISVNTGTGVVTLPTSGIFLVQYTVRFEYTPAVGLASNGTGTAQLQQTPGPALVTQPAILTDTVDVTTASAATPMMSRLITGAVVITTSSASNNQISLLITTTGDTALTGVTLPSTDANAQMWILQLN